MLYVLLLLSLLNFAVLVGLAVYVVRFRERVDRIVADVLDMLDMKPEVPPRKTWDEKFEEELQRQAERMRAESGLADPWGVERGEPKN